MTKPTEILLHDAKVEAPQETIAELMRKVIVLLGEDPNREGLRKTPERFEKALKYLTSGYQQNMESLLNGATFSVHYDEMVVVKDIEFFSLCEHHLLPFFWQSARGVSAKQARAGAKQDRAAGEHVRATAANSGTHDQPDCRSHPGEDQSGRRGRDY